MQMQRTCIWLSVAAVLCLLASPATAVPIVQLSLAVTDDHDLPIAGNLHVGQNFWIDFSVQDLRSDFMFAGIAQAGTDILYDPALAAPTGAKQPGPHYTFGFQASLLTPGVLSVTSAEPFDITNAQHPFPPLGSGRELVARFQMTALATGILSLETHIPGAQSMLVADGTGIAHQNDPNMFLSLIDTEILGTSISAPIAVPEPSAVALFLSACAVLSLRYRRGR